MPSQGAEQRSTLRKSIKKLCLSTALVSVLSAPSVAQQIIADGTDETVAPGTIINTGTAGGGSGSGLVARNDGTILADGPVSITTGGYGAIGVAAFDRGQINLTGATINTSGPLAPGITVNGVGSKIVATDTDISTGGQYSPGVAVIYGGTYVQNGGSVATTGNNSSGYQIAGGSTAGITGVDITTSGTSSHGLEVSGNGSSLRMEGGSISTAGVGSHGAFASGSGTLVDLVDTSVTTTGDYSHGIFAQGGGVVNATRVDVTTSGGYSHGARADGVGSAINFNGGSITTTGEHSTGLSAQNGGVANLDGVDIHVSGANSDGLWSQSGGTIRASNTNILADGNSVHGVWANGGVVQLTDTTITTTGTYGVGMFLSDNGSITGERVTIDTQGDTSHGIHLNSGVVNLSDSRITTHGNNASGVLVLTDGRADLIDTSIGTSGNNAAGVWARDGGQITVDGSTISTTGNDSFGARSSGAGSSISITNSTIRTEGFGSLATRAENGGHLSISGSSIATAGTYGHGLQAFQDSSAQIENSMIETQGDTAYGLAASAASEIKASNVIITTGGPRSHAVWAGAGGHVVVDSAIINTSGYGSDGLFTAGGTIDANNVDVTTSGSQAAGALAYVGTINLSNSRVTTHASPGLAAFLSGTVNATNVEVIVDGAGNSGVQAGHGGTINLDSVKITGTNGNKGISIGDGGAVIGTNVAVDVQSSGNIAAIGLNMFGDNGNPLIDLTNSSIIVGGEGSAGLSAATGGQGTVRLKDSILEAKDGTAIQIYSSNFDIELDGSSVVGRQLFNVPEYAGTDPRVINIKATNGSYLEGDVHVGAGDGQHAAISLDQGSVLKGATDGLHELNVANNSIWQITGDSNVDTLLNDNGTVAFGPDGAFKTSTVGSLDSRNGSFLFNTKLNEGGAASETDKLVVAGDTAGDGKFFIANKGGQGAVTGTGATDGIKLTDIAGSSDAEFELGSAAIVGIYDYKLVKADGQNWYLQTEGDDPVDPVGPPSGHIVDIVPGYNIALSAAQEHVLTSLDTFHERVGELRSQEMEDGFHAWTRGIGKTGSYSPKINGYNGGGFGLDTAGMQIGGDYSLGGVLIAGDKLTFGVFGELAHSDFDVDGRTAHGSISSKGIGGYATWQQNAPSERKPGTGAYIDVVAKHDWLDFGVRARSVTDFELRHSYKGKANTASIETGYGFDLGNNVVLQPQAQLTWSKVTADSFTDGYGIAVHGQETESLVGRLGMRLEKTWYLDEVETVAPAPVEPRRSAKGRNGKGKAVAVTRPATGQKKKFVKSVTGFVDANVRHEFKGNSGLVASGTPIGADMGGTRFDIGVGAVAKVSEHVGIYGRAAVEFGGPSDVAGKVTAGLRITW
ncbi:autotransporter outer membrane beta-barrel domain-containing protein [Rhizobium sp. GR12]|uniref:autotransporter outer membrane beta-barrel domain-containing protein n=1 Tax=Rhizobium sp. GR12 TaxID=3053925 RepID=UPI002FBEEBA7